MSWNFEKTENTFRPIAPGDYRVRIAEVVKATASTGKEMLKITMQVSGQKSKLFYNLVFLPDRPEITNRNLTDIFMSFHNLAMGDLNIANWVGKVGAVHVENEEYNGNIQARVKYFIRRDKQDSLPAWVEPPEGNAVKDAVAAVPTDKDGFMRIADSVASELPFT